MSDRTALRDQAADWVVALHQAEGPERGELERRCQAWQDQDERHRTLFRQMQTLWNGLDADPPRRARPGLWVLWLLIGLLAWQLPWTLWRGDAHTGAGERLVINLDDGSRLTLDTGSAVRLDLNADLRRVHLLRGRVFARVAKDPHRPFQIVTRHGTAEALGTEYSVQLVDNATRVAVKESSVRVTPAGHPSAARVLRAGQGATLTRRAVSPPAPLPPGDFEWRRGRLVFNDAPLDRVLDRLGAHRSGLLLASPSLPAGLHFTGVLPADDSDRALAVLAEALPVRVHRLTPYVVWVAGR
ncbi:FecR family protein [Alloalcanivorax sp. C16-1]|uniref:FecR family protein n=1 Tax=Alloalcanivorax sp. C16-1 TaxID=3390051 RepID=UPI003970B059